MRRSRNHVLGAILLAFGLLLGACGSGGDEGTDTGGTEPEEKGSINVGSDSFYEAQIVGAMYALVLEDAGYEVTSQLDLDSREVRLPAMESGEIDVAPEYIATLLSVLDPDSGGATTPEDGIEALTPLLADMGLELLEPSAAVDVNAFVVTQETADEFELASVSDLAGVADQLTLGAPPECPKRPYCIPGLKEVYGVDFGDNFKPLEYGAATVQSLEAGAIDVALLFSTDPLISQKGLVLLDDDKDLQQADNLTPLIRSEVLTDEIAELLNAVSAVLTTDNITPLNSRVLVDQEDPEDVAFDFLQENGLL
ncbi:MAG: ABC transporter substrate-binding protein [Actinobacteria bacterium]|nr:ABC transporter substrate-binding protein [Actinomycetota bacterium]